MHTLPTLSNKIVTLIHEHGRLTKSDLEKLTGANPNTLKKHLAELVKQRMLNRHGKGKTTFYTGG